MKEINSKLSPKERKKLARLKKEQNQLLEKAYKIDGDDYNPDILNSKYESIQREINKLEQP